MTPFNRAIFAADILRNNKTPNILAEKIFMWNIKKISLTAAAIFVIILSGFSAVLAQEYFSAYTAFERAQERLQANADTFTLKENFDALISALKGLNDKIAAQDISPQKFNALVKLGKIADGKIILSKIKASEETFELEGVAESPNAVKNYLNRLKVVISPKVKLKNSSENDGQIFFSISINF